MPFDHRTSLVRDIIGHDKINSRQRRQIEKLKFLIYQAFLKVYNAYSNKSELSVLVDEQFGARILRDAKKRGIQICVPVEASGEKELKFEYGNAFGRHINKFAPDYVKVLVNYNPLNRKINQRQRNKLNRLSDFCRKNNYHLLLELLVPPTAKDLEISGTLAGYESKLKIKRTVDAINEIKKAAKPAIWKMEGFSRAGWQKVLKALPKNQAVIVLGRGEDEPKVKKWLIAASGFARIIGFAVGRTIFLKSLKKYYSGKMTEESFINRLSLKFGSFIRLWKKNDNN